MRPLERQKRHIMCKRPEASEVRSAEEVNEILMNVVNQIIELIKKGSDTDES